VRRFAAEYELAVASLDDFADEVVMRCGVPDMKGMFGSGHFRGSVGYLGPERNYCYWSGAPHEATRIADSLVEYCQLWVLPFLDQYRSLPALLEGVAAEDARLWVGASPEWAVTVAIAYDFVGKHERATRFLVAMSGRYPIIAERYASIVAFYVGDQPASVE
jgi:hypothetical protein